MMTKFPILLSLLFCSVATGQIQLFCKLEWKRYDTGSPLYPNAVSAYGDSLYIARASFPRGYQIGTLEKNSLLAHFEAGVLVSFEVLTNPNGCQLAWINGRGQFGPVGAANGKLPLGIPLSQDSDKVYVGRGRVSNAWFTGAAWPSKGEIIMSKVWQEYYTTTSQSCFLWIFCSTSTQYHYYNYNKLSNYELLTSYSPGLSLTIYDFKLHDDDPPLEGLDFLGEDEIENLSEGDVIQTITHTKRVSESFSVTHSESTTQSHTASVSAEAKFFGVGMSASYSYENSKTQEDSTTLESTRETEITVSREVSLPPGKSVEACSTVKITEGYEKQYSAKGAYRGVGMSGAEVERVLKDFDVLGTVDGDAVIVNIEGTLSANWAMMTRFQVVPSDAMQGCSLIKSQADRSRARRERRWEQWREERKVKWIERKALQRNSTRGFQSLDPSQGPVVLTYQPDPVTETRYEGVGISVEEYRASRESGLMTQGNSDKMRSDSTKIPGTFGVSIGKRSSVLKIRRKNDKEL